MSVCFATRFVQLNLMCIRAKLENVNERVNQFRSGTEEGNKMLKSRRQKKRSKWEWKSRVRAADGAREKEARGQKDENVKVNFILRFFRNVSLRSFD